MSAVLIKIIPIAGPNHAATRSPPANPVVSLLGGGAPDVADLDRTGPNLCETTASTHILLGADHLLFVLGLIWIRGRRLATGQDHHGPSPSDTTPSLAAAAFGLIGVPETTAQRLPSR